MNIHTVNSPKVNWFTTLFQQGSGASPSCLTGSAIWAAEGPFVFGMDLFTGKEIHRILIRAGDHKILFLLPYDDGLIAYVSDGNLYKIWIEGDVRAQQMASVAHDPKWMVAYQGSIYLGSHLGGIQRVAPADESFTPGQDGRISQPVGAGVISGAPSFDDNIFYIMNSQNRMDGFDTRSLAKVWSSAPIDQNKHTQTFWSKSSFSGEYVCLQTNVKEMAAISVIDGRVAWRKEFEDNISYDGLICDAKYCYIPLENGQIVVLSITDGAFAKKFDLPVAARQLIISNGLLYGSLQATRSERPSVFAIDTASGTVVTSQTEGNRLSNSSDSPALVGLDNDILYYRTVEVVGAVRLAELAREFYAEATLMQDFNFPSGSSPSPRIPVIHTEITIFDSNGAMRPLQPVRVGATAPATIESGGVTYSVGSKNYIDLATDITGRLRIGLRAGTMDDQGQMQDGLVCPALTLFTTFMDSNQSILLRPDAHLHEMLATMTAEDLRDAQDYDRQPIVQDSYRSNVDAMENVSKTISACFSMVNRSVEAKSKKRGITREYLAKGCDETVICCCLAGDYASPIVCDRDFAFDLTGNTNFESLDLAQTEQWVRDHPITKRVPRDFDDFWNAVKQGVAKVTGAIVYVATEGAHIVKTVVTAVINGVTATVEYVLDSIEKVALLVQGVFNTIVGSMRKVLEALSFAFSWPSILELKDKISTVADGAYASLFRPGKDNGPSLYDQVSESLIGGLENLRTRSDSAFEHMKDKLRQISVGGEESGLAGPRNPASGGSTANWLQSKLNDNLLSGALQLNGATARSAVATSTILIPEFEVPHELLNEMQNVVDALRKKVTGQVKAEFDRISADLTPGVGLDVFSSSLEAVISVLRGGVAIAIDLAEAGLATLLSISKTLMVAAQQYCKKTIEIPFLSDFYRYITKDGIASHDLTPLDLASLLTAIPASIALGIGNAVSAKKRTPRAPLALLSDATIVSVCAGASQVVWAGVSTALSYAVAFAGRTEFSWVRKVTQGVRCILTAGLGALVTRGLLLGSEILNHEGSPPRLLAGLGLWATSTISVVVDLFAAAAPESWDLSNAARGFSLFAGAGLGLVNALLVFINFVTLVFNITSYADAALLVNNLLGDVALALRAVACPAALLPNPAYAVAILTLAGVIVAVAGGVKIAGSFPPSTGAQTLAQVPSTC